MAEEPEVEDSAEIEDNAEDDIGDAQQRDEKIPRKVRTLLGRQGAKIARLEKMLAEALAGREAAADTGTADAQNRYRGLIFDGDTGKWYRKPKDDDADDGNRRATGLPARQTGFRARHEDDETDDEGGVDMSQVRRNLIREIRAAMPDMRRSEIVDAVEDVLEEAAATLEEAGVSKPDAAAMRHAINEAMFTLKDENEVIASVLENTLQEEAKRYGYKLVKGEEEGQKPDVKPPEGSQAGQPPKPPETKPAPPPAGQTGKPKPPAARINGGSSTPSAPPPDEDRDKQLNAQLAAVAEAMSRRMRGQA